MCIYQGNTNLIINCMIISITDTKSSTVRRDDDDLEIEKEVPGNMIWEK